MLPQDCTKFPTEIYVVPEIRGGSRVIAGHPARTFSSGIQVVRTVAKRPNILGEPDTRLQFGLQEIAFVQEQHKLDICQKLVAAYGFPEKNAIFLLQRRGVSDHQSSSNGNQPID